MDHLGTYMKVVYLDPRTSFKGERISSDTLFGAICWGIRSLYGKSLLEELLEEFRGGNPPFILSSTYPFQDSGGDGKIHYFPRPLGRPFRKKAQTREGVEKTKNLKKITLLPQELFKSYVDGELTDEYLHQNSKICPPRYDLGGKEYHMRNGALVREGNLFTRGEIPRNAINRLSSATEGALFFNRETFLSDDTGLYFLLDIFDEIEDAVNGALGFLGDRGLGGDISVGKGAFEMGEPQEFSVLEGTGGEKLFTTLSLYHPAKEELEHFSKRGEKSWYKLERRKGKMESAFVNPKDVWKDTVYMFSEGSSFPAIEDRRTYGDNPIVKRTPFEVQQYGYAFPVGMEAT